MLVSVTVVFLPTVLVHHFTSTTSSAMSQSTEQLEEEVKSLVKEFMHDYNENLVQSLVSALQYYFVTLNVYAGSNGEYCVFSDEFYNQFNVVKTMVTAAASTRIDSRFKKHPADTTGIMDYVLRLVQLQFNGCPCA